MNANQVKLDIAPNLAEFSGNAGPALNGADKQKFENVLTEVTQKAGASSKKPEKAAHQKSEAPKQSEKLAERRGVEAERTDRSAPNSEQNVSQDTDEVESSGIETGVPQADSSETTTKEGADQGQSEESAVASTWSLAQAGLEGNPVKLNLNISLADGIVDDLNGGLPLISDVIPADATQGGQVGAQSLAGTEAENPASALNMTTSEINVNQALAGTDQAAGALSSQAAEGDVSIEEILQPASQESGPADGAVLSDSLRKAGAEAGADELSQGVGRVKAAVDPGNDVKAQKTTGLGQENANAMKGTEDAPAASQDQNAGKTKARMTSSLVQKHDVPVAETPKEAKAALSEKKSSSEAPKGSDISTKPAFLDPLASKDSGGNQSGDNFLLSGNSKQAAIADISSAKGDGDIDFNSLMNPEGAASQMKIGAPPGHPLSASAISLSGPQGPDLHQANHLAKLEGNAAFKPAEVFDRSVVEQIVSKASLINRNGQSEMRIQLDPPSLGTINVQVTMHGDKVSANLVADNSIARDIIDRNIQHLRNSFTDQGLKIEHMSVNVGGDPGHQTADQQRHFNLARGFTGMNQNETGRETDIAPLSLSEASSAYRESGGISLFV